MIQTIHISIFGRFFPAGFAACLALAVSASESPAQTPAAGSPALTDARIEQAIRAGVGWLKAQRDPELQWERFKDRQDRHWGGESALVILAMLYCGADPATEDWLREALGWLDHQPLNGVYATACRAHAFALLRGEKSRQSLERDVRWLLNAVWPAGSQQPGSYDYVPAPRSQSWGRWDNSVTQFGNLGVWMGAEAGVAIPRDYWEMVGAHWVRTQARDGGWQYEMPDRDTPQSTGSMTAAGLASLFVVLDYRYADAPGSAAPIVGAINRGLDWLGRYFTPNNARGPYRWDYYYLYGVERVGRASGYRYFGPHDWFRIGAGWLLEQQRSDGSWPMTGEDMYDRRNTALALMFLSHGRAPVMFSKLETSIEAADRLRDVAGLTRYAKYSLERPLNWQVVNLSAPIDDLLEAPVLYLFGRERREFTSEERDRIREYCQRGGMLFGVVGERGEGFRGSFEQLARELFPDLPLTRLTPEHKLFSGEVQFRIDNPPPMLAVDNGVRTLMLLCLRDIAGSWVRFAAEHRNEDDLKLGMNVWLYACDKVIPRSRLESPILPVLEREPVRTLYVARIRYDGAWDVEPLGWQRLIRYMNNETATRVLLMSGLSLASEIPPEVRIAHLTGTQGFRFSAAERAGLRRFLSGGGTLIVDATGGSAAFTRAFEEEMREVLRDEPREVAPDSFLITGEGIDGAVNLERVGFLRAALPIVGDRKTPLLKVYGTKNRYSVIVSPLDLSAGMLGTPIFGLRGYDRQSTLDVMRNLVLYAGLSTAEKAALQRGSDKAGP